MPKQTAQGSALGWPNRPFRPESPVPGPVKAVRPAQGEALGRLFALG